MIFVKPASMQAEIIGHDVQVFCAVGCAHKVALSVCKIAETVSNLLPDLMSLARH